MLESLTRDFVGYGRTPPDAAWPNEARVAVNVVVNYEEGAEYAVSDGDGHSESALTEVSAPRVPVGDRDLSAESMYEYGSRAGFWRVGRLLAERNLKATVFGCALGLERNGDAVAFIRERDWDVCAHGRRWIEHYKLDEATERSEIRDAVCSLTTLFGQRPLGWYCRYAPSIRTRALLVDEGGFLYDSDSYADDLPFWIGVAGRPHLVVPYSLVTNDVKLTSGLFTARDFFELLRDAFEVLRREGRTRPRMMSVGLHPRLVGHPARSAGLERFLDHVMAAGDEAWICRRLDIARHWMERFPTTAGTMSDERAGVVPPRAAVLSA
jgi:allantoinase